jgi:hypothetical protein
METRQLLAFVVQVLASGSEELDLADAPKDRLRRREDLSYFNPSPQEIRAATLLIQAEWSDRERMVRASGVRGVRHWRVPHARFLGTSLPEE